MALPGTTLFSWKAEGKKRMKAIGKVDVPQEAFMKAIGKVDIHGGCLLSFASKFSLMKMLEMLKACPVLHHFEMVQPCELDAEQSVEFPVQSFHKCMNMVTSIDFVEIRTVKLARLLIQVAANLVAFFIKREPKDKKYIYRMPQHDGCWHEDQEPKTIKKLSLSFMRSGMMLTFE